MRRTIFSDYDMFLTHVLNVPVSHTKNIRMSQGLAQAISNGTFLNDIKEEEFSKLLAFAEKRQYKLLIDYFEDLLKSYQRERKRYHNRQYKKRRRNNVSDR